MPGKSVAETVPEQQQGAKTDTHHKKDYGDIEMAKQMFLLIKERIADPNHWYDLTGKGTASFQLTDENGHELNQKAEIGNRIKINIPGPGSLSGKGFDWVEVEAIDEINGDNHQTEHFTMRVRPTDNPDDQANQVAHFFKNTATSSFSVERNGNVVITSVHGRNEVPNTESSGWLDRLRNFLIGLFASAGLSHPQWKALVVALHKEPDQ